MGFFMGIGGWTTTSGYLTAGRFVNWKNHYFFGKSSCSSTNGPWFPYIAVSSNPAGDVKTAEAAAVGMIPIVGCGDLDRCLDVAGELTGSGPGILRKVQRKVTGNGMTRHRNRPWQVARWVKPLKKKVIFRVKLLIYQRVSRLISHSIPVLSLISSHPFKT